MHDFIAALPVLLLGAGLTLAGTFLLLTRRGLRSQLRRLPRTLAREAQASPEVKLGGRLVAHAPVHAPLADVDCAYYQMTVEQVGDREPGEEEGIPAVVFTEKEYAEGWQLEDESGRIALQPEGARFLYIRVREFSPGGTAWPSGVRYDLVSRYLLPRAGGGSDTRTRLREERLDLGTPVVVLGRVEEGPHGRVLTGGDGLEVFGETERELSAFKASELFSLALLVMGALVCAAWAWALGRASEPLPHLKATPISRPKASGQSR